MKREVFIHTDFQHGCTLHGKPVIYHRVWMLVLPGLWFLVEQKIVEAA